MGFQIHKNNWKEFFFLSLVAIDKTLHFYSVEGMVWLLCDCVDTSLKSEKI